MIADTNNENVLHCACTSSNPSAIGIVKTLVDIGGRELVMIADTNNENALHLAFKYAEDPVIPLLIKKVLNLTLEVNLVFVDYSTTAFWRNKSYMKIGMNKLLRHYATSQCKW